jgi:predicted ArsR family transcriptional regulator
MSERQLDALLRDVGRRLCDATREAGLAVEEGGSLESRVRAAAEVLTALGADVDVERSSDGFRLRGQACPLSDAVRIQPKTCRAIQELVAGLTGVVVHECCQREGMGPSRCCFEVKR